MNKKGFTLVELLAVIAILAILVVIALPNVIDMFQGAKKNTFVTEIQTIMKQAQSQWVLEGGTAREYKHLLPGTETSSTLSGTETSSTLQLQGNDLAYDIKINANGEFTLVQVCSKDYSFKNTTIGFKATDVKTDNVFGSADSESSFSTAASGLGC